ncbi:MAG: hypothetical protein R3B72_28735 [Polyangiaceae bacterium]
MTDLLDLATEALKNETSNIGDDLSARRTRQRIIDSVEHQRRRRGRRLFVMVPLAALVIAGSALAGGGVAHFWQGPPATTQVALADEAERLATGIAPPVEATTATPPDDEVSAESGAENAGAPLAARTREEVEAAHEARVASLYGEAHAAHFGGASPSEALAKWNAYLQAEPRGRLVPEAMFNRAICLVKLGRHGEARQALAPFASGRFGSYRQAEAERLLAVLP